MKIQQTREILITFILILVGVFLISCGDSLTPKEFLINEFSKINLDESFRQKDGWAFNPGNKNVIQKNIEQLSSLKNNTASLYSNCNSRCSNKDINMISDTLAFLEKFIEVGRMELEFIDAAVVLEASQPGVVTSYLKAMNSGAIIGNATATGAAIGSVVPIVGTLIGAGLGAAAGYIISDGESNILGNTQERKIFEKIKNKLSELYQELGMMEQKFLSHFEG